ncbi:MAG: SWIM zinc finger family protein [Thermoplasmata archaeon]
MEGRTHIAGIAWRFTTGSVPGPIRTQTRRHGRTLIFSELAALRAGLREAARAACRDLVVLLPDRRAVALMRGEGRPRFPLAEAEAVRLRPLLDRFRSVRFESEFDPDSELVHSVGEALDAGLHAAAGREQHRVTVMERIIERAREVRLERQPDGWVANGRYTVSLDPMVCECPAWAVRWSRTPIAGRRAQRLPCKHIVALALAQGISVPADLSELARRAPW